MKIFSYGSLVNEESLRQTSENAKMLGPATLCGHQRKFNAMSDAFPDVALNVIPCDGSEVQGVVIDFPEEEMDALRRRETGYELVDVTHLVKPQYTSKVYCFIAPNISDYRDKKIYRSYLNTCLAAYSIEEQKEWLEETIIDCEILEDTDNPQYKPLA